MIFFFRFSEKIAWKMEQIKRRYCFFLFLFKTLVNMFGDTQVEALVEYIFIAFLKQRCTLRHINITRNRGVGTHSRLGGPNSSRRHHGWRRAENFLKIRGSRSLEMAISEPYLPISVRTVSWLSETCSAFF